MQIVAYILLPPIHVPANYLAFNYGTKSLSQVELSTQNLDPKYKIRVIQ